MVDGAQDVSSDASIGSMLTSSRTASAIDPAPPGCWGWPSPPTAAPQPGSAHRQMTMAQRIFQHQADRLRIHHHLFRSALSCQVFRQRLALASPRNKAKPTSCLPSAHRFFCSSSNAQLIVSDKPLTTSGSPAVVCFFAVICTRNQGWLGPRYDFELGRIKCRLALRSQRLRLLVIVEGQFWLIQMLRLTARLNA